MIIRNWFGRKLNFVRNQNNMSIAKYREPLVLCPGQAVFEGHPSLLGSNDLIQMAP